MCPRDGRSDRQHVQRFESSGKKTSTRHFLFAEGTVGRDQALFFCKIVKLAKAHCVIFEGSGCTMAMSRCESRASYTAESIDFGYSFADSMFLASDGMHAGTAHA